MLVQITGGGERYRELHPSPAVDTAERFFVADRDNPSSVRSSLAPARESVRTTRDIVPSEAWRSINELCLWVTQELDAETSHRRRYGIHSRVVERCQQISGLLADTMSHDAAYQFFRLGRGIERADMTTRIIDVAAAMLLGREDLARFDNTLWMAVLQSLSAYQMYRQKVRRRIYGPDVIAYLLKDTQFPRAIAFSMRELGAALAMLPRSGEPIKKLGDLRRMLALRELERALDRGPAPVDRRRAAQARRAARPRRGDVVSALDDERARPVAGRRRKANRSRSATVAVTIARRRRKSRLRRPRGFRRSAASS